MHCSKYFGVSFLLTSRCGPRDDVQEEAGGARWSQHQYETKTIQLNNKIIEIYDFFIIASRDSAMFY
jgi:hypothetical protein